MDHQLNAEALQSIGDDSGKPTGPQMEALISAALYAAEQQRIANLIAFLGAEGGPYKDINDIPLGRQTAIAEIREGLGL